MPDDLPTRKRAPTKALPPVAYLRECFYYNPETGWLRWCERPREQFATEPAHKAWNTRQAWVMAGCIGPNGYLYVGIGDSLYYAHRIIWKLVTGEEPLATIDHRDGNRLNNSWDNLRAASQIQQTWNTRPKNNASGYRGAIQHRKKWHSRIRINGAAIRHLGTFGTPEEAAAAYETAARELHGKFYRPP